MRIIVSILLLSVAIDGCDGSDSETSRHPVAIISATLPETGQINQPMEIALRAALPNGCWSDLIFELKPAGELYRLQATALFNNQTACPELYRVKDTVISFTPTHTGAYTFQVNEAPFTITTKTVFVVD